MTPRLRAVAWPEPGFAYAVGDEGAMWTWRKSTGFWEPDPAAPPNLIRGNFTGLAFDPAEPARGYAVGKQGLLLGYGRQWTQETLPPGVPAEANFTSVAFAGSEALATWRYPHENPTGFVGGVIASSGSGWQVVAETGSAEAPVLVSGLPDGGAALAFENGAVSERSGPGAPWVEAPENAGGYPVALAAVREETVVRSVVSVWPEAGQAPGFAEDQEQLTNGEVEGSVPLLSGPYGLAGRGFVERQTPTGWRDEQHESFPVPSGHEPTDLPREPDPILALLVSADGNSGWAVGGETGERVGSEKEQIQTAGIERYGASAAPPSNFRSVPIPAGPAGTATFAFGGGAQCAGPCADQMGTGIGPEAWLSSAVARSAAVPGVRDFIYTGAGVASVVDEELAPTRLGVTLSPAAFAREESAYAQRLGAAAGSIPVYPTPTHTDLDRSGSLATFASAFGGVTAVAGEELARGYYSFDTSGEGPPVRVIVLDYAERSLGAPQDCWLAQELEGAKLASEPAIVVGSRDLGGVAEGTPPLDAPETVAILLNGTTPNLEASNCPIARPGAASAYFFDFPEANRTYRLASGGKSLPAFGSGTLGYVIKSGLPNFTGASGFLVASVGAPDPATGVAPVSARLIPNVGELAIEAADGTLLRRSSTALFRGLARRPRGGGRCAGTNPQRACESLSPNPYAPIPSECRGAGCGTGIFPEYRFSSSRPDVANFVATDKSSGNPRSVLLGTSGKPTVDPTSGLLCAFNAGTTTVTLEAGGFAYSTVVTVQPGSVQRPCGTVPLENLVAEGPELANPVLPPTETAQPGFESPKGTLPPPPPPPPSTVTPTVTPTTTTPVTPHVVHVPPPQPVSLPNFFTSTPTLAPIVPIVPPPPPPAVEPTPPSGTSPVTQPAFSPEPEEEEEAAFDLVHHAVAVHGGRRVVAANAAYPLGSGSGPGMWTIYALPSLVVIAALSGYGVAGRRRRRQPEPAFLRTRR